MRFSLQDHFDETQYERGRADGLRKLKPNAVPKKFVFMPPSPGRPTKRKWLEDQQSFTVQRPNHLTDHSYHATPVPGSQHLESRVSCGEDESHDVGVAAGEKTAGAFKEAEAGGRLKTTRFPHYNSRLARKRRRRAE